MQDVLLQGCNNCLDFWLVSSIWFHLFLLFCTLSHIFQPFWRLFSFSDIDSHVAKIKKFSLIIFSNLKHRFDKKKKCIYKTKYQKNTLINIWRRAARTASRVFLLLRTDSGTAGSFLVAAGSASFFLDKLFIKVKNYIFFI